MSDLDRQSSGTQTPEEIAAEESVPENKHADEADDTARAVQMTIAHVIYNRGLGHSLETCESLAAEIMQAVSAVETL